MGIGKWKQIMLVKKDPAKGADGVWDESNETRWPLWAEVQRLSGNRAYTHGQTQITDGVQFKIRFKPVFNPNCDYKIIYSGRVHTIHTIEPDKEKRFFWIIKAQSTDVR